MNAALPQHKACQLHFAHPVHLRAAAARPTRSTNRSRVVSRAELGGMLDTVITWGALAAGIGATVYAVFYDWHGGTQHKQHQRQQQSTALLGPGDNFSWAVMGGVSFIPLFNYLAWILGALQSDSPRPYYWAAALYALPLLRNGFDQDWFSISMLLLGAAHIQALRIGATEPELQAKLQQQLKPLAVVNSLASAAGAAAGAAFGSRGSSARQLGEGTNRAVDDVLQRSETVESEEVLRQREELAEFDRRLKELSGDDSSRE